MERPMEQCWLKISLREPVVDFFVGRVAKREIFIILVVVMHIQIPNYRKPMEHRQALFLLKTLILGHWGFLFMGLIWPLSEIRCFSLPLIKSKHGISG